MLSRSKKMSREQAVQLVDELIRLGYMKFADQRMHDDLRNQLIDTVRNGYLGTELDDRCAGLDRRQYHADNEWLAEGAIAECIEQLEDVFRQERVQLTEVVDHFGQDRYEVSINGERHLIYTQRYVERSSDLNYGADVWTVAAMRTLEIINMLFERAGSSERAFMFSGGNDGTLWVLTEEIYRVYLERSNIPAGPHYFQTAQEIRSQLTSTYFDV